MTPEDWADAIISAPMIDKFFASPEAALADVPNGATILIGGQPFALTQAAR